MIQEARQWNAALQEQLQLNGLSLDEAARRYGWYPTVHLARAIENPGREDLIEQVSAFVHHPLKLDLLLSSGAGEEFISTKQAEQPREEANDKVSAEQPAEQPAIRVDIRNGEEDVVDPEPEEEETGVELPPIPGLKPVTGDMPAFTPFFTVDYFASQGIKVDPNMPAQTRFDSQLRSFTQWLKTMKRIDYQTGAPASADPVVDKQAQSSLRPNDVVTESMAEVLIKQGKHQQAIEMLAKLILLHPEKSHFFAAQIENIKAQQ